MNKRANLFIAFCLAVFMAAMVKAHSQCWTCLEAPTVTNLPFTDSWCIDQGTWGECFYQNPDDLPNAVNDCWECMSNTRWYRIQVAPGGGIISMSLDFDLCNQNGTSCGEVRGYYHLFDGCPEDGGELLSMPRNPYPMPHCWNDDILMLSCWEGQQFNEFTCFSGAPETATGFIYNYPPSTSMTIDFELAEGEYFLCVSPSSNCSNGSWGCIDLTLDGPIILGLEPDPMNLTYEEPEQQEGKYFTPGIGVYALRDRKRYIIFGQNNQP